MRLVTFQAPGRPAAAGALIDCDERVVDLQQAFAGRWNSKSPHLASVLALAEGGAEGMDAAAETVTAARATTGPHILARADVKLLAPIPRPPQMRDFLCFSTLPI